MLGWPFAYDTGVVQLSVFTNATFLDFSFPVLVCLPNHLHIYTDQADVVSVSERSRSPRFRFLDGILKSSQKSLRKEQSYSGSLWKTSPAYGSESRKEANQCSRSSLCGSMARQHGTGWSAPAAAASASLA